MMYTLLNTFKKIRRMIDRHRLLKKKPFVAFVYEVMDSDREYGENYMIYYTAEAADGIFHGCVYRDGNINNVIYDPTKRYWRLETLNK